MINIKNKAKRFYTLSSDRLFKSVMMEEKNRNILEQILKDVLKKDVKIKKFMPMERPVTGKDEKVSNLDMIIETDFDEIINIEVNATYDDYVRERNFEYITSLFRETVKRQDKKKEYRYTIQIRINYKDKSRELIKKYIMKAKDGDILLDKVIVYAVNIDRIKEEWYHNNVKGNKEKKR